MNNISQPDPITASGAPDLTTRRRPLLEGWRLRWCSVGEGIPAKWPTLDEDAMSPSIIAAVPGDVRDDLVRAGIVSEPLAKGQWRDSVWVEGSEFWYFLDFVASDDVRGADHQLLFGGVDTDCDIWLNGVLLGEHHNALIEFAVQCGDALRPRGVNRLVVRVDPGLQRARAHPHPEMVDLLPVFGLPLERMWMRKPQFTFGWDWAPRVISCGIWRPVVLQTTPRVRLQDVQLRTDLSDGHATVTAVADVLAPSRHAEHAAQATVTVTMGHGDRVYTSTSDVTVPSGSCKSVTVLVDIPDPALWWPHTLGSPELYSVEVTVRVGAELVDSRQLTYGLRTISLVQEKLAGGEGLSFGFEVNGVALFCQGANWVPPDQLVGRAPDSKYRALLDLATQARINMLRVTGIAVYESDLFYQLCDEAGILVWQDFMFGCSYYPEDNEFLEEVRGEATKAVRRLRHHPSIALWCGNNECEWIHSFDGAEGVGRYIGEAIFAAVLPEVCAIEDPDRVYWRSSPWGGTDGGNGSDAGDRHAWEIGTLGKDAEANTDFQLILTDTSKFVTEFGALAAAPLPTLREWVGAASGAPLAVDDDAWREHANRYERSLPQTALRRYWPEPEPWTVATYVRATQILQSDFLTLAFRHWRGRRGRTNGALMWMLSDSWPVSTGWSLIDYCLRPTRAYYGVKRSLHPVICGIASQPSDDYRIWVDNDQRTTFTGTLEIVAASLTDPGAPAHHESVQVRAETGHLACGVLPRAVIDACGPDGIVYCILRDSVGRVVSTDRRLVAGFGYAAFALPAARVHLQVVGDELVVTSAAVALSVALDCPAGVSLTDNYFDIFPGQEARVALTGARDMWSAITATAEVRRR